MRQRRTVHSRSSARRKLVWSSLASSVSFTTTAQVEAIDLLSPLKVAGASVLGCTVMRSLINVYDLSTVAGGDSIAFGCIVQDQDLTGLGTAGVPDPSGTPELDWYFLDRRWASAISTNASYGNSGFGNTFTYDIRSKRKCEELGQTATLCIRLPTHGTLPATVTAFTRTLVALA